MDQFYHATVPDAEQARVRREYVDHWNTEDGRQELQSFGIKTLEELHALVTRSIDEGEMYRNSEYQVTVYQVEATEHWPAMVHLSIKRNDRAVIHDWRDMQEIKNLLVGREHEAVELYPAESRLVDAANQFHLWALKDESLSFPFGFKESIVTSTQVAGSRQRERESHDG